jgi:hypothetical protein
MAFFLIRYERRWYANDELFISAVSGGERKLMRMLSSGETKGQAIFETTVYRVGEVDQREACLRFSPEVQDIDEICKHMKQLSGAAIDLMRAEVSKEYPAGRVIVLPAIAVPEKLYHYKNYKLFRIQDYREPYKYRMVPNLASIPVCGRRYIALDTVNTRAEKPIVITVH